MTQLLILSCIVIITLAGLLGYQAWVHAGNVLAIVTQQDAERASWAQERRFLIDRAIAQHVGEVLALEREDTRKSMHPSQTEERQPRPLLEGLS